VIFWAKKGGNNEKKNVKTVQKPKTQVLRSGVKEGHKKRRKNTTIIQTNLLINFINTTPLFNNMKASSCSYSSIVHFLY
jgi:hypothetical protein